MGIHYMFLKEDVLFSRLNMGVHNIKPRILRFEHCTPQKEQRNSQLIVVFACKVFHCERCFDHIVVWSWINGNDSLSHPARLD